MLCQTQFSLFRLKVPLAMPGHYYVKHNFDAESFYVGNTIRKLCEARDNCCLQFFERGELLRVIDVLCTKLFGLIILYCN